VRKKRERRQAATQPFTTDPDFYWQELGCMAIPNCKEGWKSILVMYQ
jgi:hypothetical protein